MQIFEQFVSESDDSSWRKINSNRQEILGLCIKSGIPFEIEDFTKLYHKYKGDFWLGANPSTWYALAISSGNSSAIKAWETHFKIEPYLLMGKRLAPGTDFIWDGRAVRVTSIDADRIVAVGQQGSKERRYRITHEDLAARSKVIRNLIKERSADWQERVAILRAKEAAEIESLINLEVKSHVRRIAEKGMQDGMFTASYCIHNGFTVRAFSKSFPTEEAISAAVETWFSARVGLVDRLAQEHIAWLVSRRLGRANSGMQAAHA